ncbi:MAG TPA: type IV toxin-antitoxin system AbiEi family antitoxin [Nocardioidaceae bacterium]|nr:type IV toxin-antitoxin system AbiEi family antitoxin [Nocardioidaceae bacterium]
MNTTARVRPADLANWMLARGRSAATTAEAAALLGVDPAEVRGRLQRHRDEFVTPARGLWIPIPPEYREWGAPEGIEIIDLLMRHLNVDYYVGWLSAVALHGAGHHAPQVFQVATARDFRDRDVGRTAFKFLTRTAVDALPRQHHPTRSGTAWISTPEVTALDLTTDITVGGGIDNVATVLLGLADEGLDLAAIASLADQFPAAAARRLGWILENLSDHRAEDLHDASVSRAPTPALLDPASGARGRIDQRWRLRINADVEAEF